MPHRVRRWGRWRRWAVVVVMHFDYLRLYATGFDDPGGNRARYPEEEPQQTDEQHGAAALITNGKRWEQDAL